MIKNKNFLYFFFFLENDFTEIGDIDLLDRDILLRIGIQMKNLKATEQKLQTIKEGLTANSDILESVKTSSSRSGCSGTIEGSLNLSSDNEPTSTSSCSNDEKEIGKESTTTTKADKKSAITLTETNLGFFKVFFLFFF